MINYGTLHKAGRGDTTYLMKTAGNLLIIEKDTPEGWEKRVYKIARAKEHDIVYKIQKTQVKSSDADRGLDRFFARAEHGAGNMLYSFADKVWNTTKEAKF